VEVELSFFLLVWRQQQDIFGKNSVISREIARHGLFGFRFHGFYEAPEKPAQPFPMSFV